MLLTYIEADSIQVILTESYLFVFFCFLSAAF